MAFAGQGFSPRPQKLLRILGMFLRYSFYLNVESFNQNRFSEPPILLSDPTEKAQFSNIAGKAIADFLSKQINGSSFTVNYEALMKLKNIPIKGRRPDLISFSRDTFFAIEAKGRWQNSPGNMAKHKLQAQSGEIRVPFSIASIAYNLYNNVVCTYHDPVNDNVPYDAEALTMLTRDYYAGLSEFLNREWFSYEDFEFGGESFYAVEPVYQKFAKYLWAEYSFEPIEFSWFLRYPHLQLILPKKIWEYAKNGISRDTQPFRFGSISQNNNIYIDNDGVGLRIF
ncbi:MAG TPA: hypothetical protein VK787_09255 [Puia sp.]|nr:hypothetical protein [Puia sp.]